MTGFKEMMPNEEPLGGAQQTYVPNPSDRVQRGALRALGQAQNLGMAAQALNLDGGNLPMTYTLVNQPNQAVSYTASSLVNS